MNEKLTVAPSPHIKDSATTASLMRSVLIALAPAAVMSVVIFGVRALLLMAVCVAAAIGTELLSFKLLGRGGTLDYSAAVTGLLLAFNLPSGLPLWQAAFGALAAVFVGKQLFGGIGQNFANPAILGRIILFISFAGPMAQFLIPTRTSGGVELVVGATPLAIASTGGTLPSYLDMFLGFIGGSLGETCTAALLLGGLYLIATKVISPIIPVSFLGTIAAMAVLTGSDPIFHLLAGGAMLGAFFMATDYVTSPVTSKGKVIFGIGCGLITMIIRVYGSYPEGVSFAILLMNIVTPHIDNLTKSKPLGGTTK